ncbi:MAG: polysaccharide deacetylase family protein [Cyclobacteriaceae bacterium]|nr:polysaccharide deacetylase family protein [Cyclobacteriaceae bacterium]
MPKDEKNIYLTFDDGPIPGLTPAVSDILKSFGIKATFFCVGHNVEKNPDVLQMLVEAGHSIGNHTYHHLKGWNTKDEAYMANVNACDQIILKYYPAYRPGLFRPPYGRIKKSQINALISSHKIIMWDVLTHDYSNRHSFDKALSKSIHATNPGSIVVFHDNIKAEKKMLYILQRYVPHFMEKGFNFKTL